MSVILGHRVTQCFTQGYTVKLLCETLCPIMGGTAHLFYLHPSALFQALYRRKRRFSRIDDLVKGYEWCPSGDNGLIKGLELLFMAFVDFRFKGRKTFGAESFRLSEVIHNQCPFLRIHFYSFLGIGF